MRAATVSGCGSLQNGCHSVFVPKFSVTVYCALRTASEQQQTDILQALTRRNIGRSVEGHELPPGVFMTRVDADSRQLASEGVTRSVLAILKGVGASGQVFSVATDLYHWSMGEV